MLSLERRELPLSSGHQHDAALGSGGGSTRHVISCITNQSHYSARQYSLLASTSGIKTHKGAAVRPLWRSFLSPHARTRYFFTFFPNPPRLSSVSLFVEHICWSIIPSSASGPWSLDTNSSRERIAHALPNSSPPMKFLLSHPFAFVLPSGYSSTRAESLSNLSVLAMLAVISLFPLPLSLVGYLVLTLSSWSTVPSQSPSKKL
ncbi:hypothetical protein C8J57DRAFT_1511876 [Mycena rebaudengoi]|nr:hypothetical protein C8J57DRAFT_1511876 [Mycena rebaudengoi]